MKTFLKRMLSLILTVVLVCSCMSIMSSAINVDESAFASGTRIAEKIDYNIIPGVSESYVVTQNNDGSNQVCTYVLDVDLDNPDIGIITSYKNYMNNLSDKPEWGMQTVREQAVAVENYYRNELNQSGFEVVAGVNGDFFDMGNGAPTGTLVMNSKVYNVNGGWPYFAILKDGTPVIREGGKDVSDVAQSVGGPAIILRNGVVDASSDYGLTVHPRTAVGIRADGSVVFVVSDGRLDPVSCGQTFEMLAEEMLALGCVDALSLDGGGSATFVSQREGEDILGLRNSPADGIERTVSTSVLIYTKNFENKTNTKNKWYASENSVYYLGDDGLPVTGEQEIEGFTYNFDETGKLTSLAVVNKNGTLVKNQWNGIKYYLGEDGLPVKGSIKLSDGYTYTFDDTTGILIKSDRKNLWYDCDGDVCYFDSEGVPVTGEQKIGEYTYSFDETGKLKDYALVKSDGTLVVNQWIGSQYYVGKDGLAVKGVQTIGGYKYTFDGTTGKFIKGEIRKEGNYTYYYIAGIKQRNWHLIDGYWHYFDRMTGYGMATADNCDKVAIDYDRKDGMYTISTTDARLLFTFDKQGRLIKGSWLETDNGKVYYWGNHERVTGWQTIDGSVYYFNNDTYAVTGKQFIDGVLYDFDADGKLIHTYTCVVNAPTCTEQGYTSYTCECGDVYLTDYVDSLGGHSNTVTVTAPTCAEQGYTAHTCTVCGNITKSDYVDATGHDYKTNVTAPTCTEKGYTAYTCQTCGDVYNDDYIEATGHDYSMVVTAPTCTQQGYTTYTCAVCGESKTDDYVDATGHIAGEWEIVTSAQIGVAGLEQKKCTVCGEIVEEREIAALVLGDANEDGIITASDARLVLRMAATIDEVPEHLRASLDMNNDGEITASDARTVLRISAEME